MCGRTCATLRLRYVSLVAADLGGEVESVFMSSLVTRVRGSSEFSSASQRAQLITTVPRGLRAFNVWPSFCFVSLLLLRGVCMSQHMSVLWMFSSYAEDAIVPWVSKTSCGRNFSPSLLMIVSLCAPAFFGNLWLVVVWSIHRCYASFVQPGCVPQLLSCTGWMFSVALLVFARWMAPLLLLIS